MSWLKLIKALMKTTAIFGVCALLVWGIILCVYSGHSEIIYGTVALFMFIIVTIALYDEENDDKESGG